MSEALNYLMKVRKDAMRPYFEFLREGGKHLDVKTRSLLSVITKVSGRTEAGFRQYLKRALQAGNSADEVLDALLACMPMLGLSKVIWSIDIILKMDLPGFRPEHLGVESSWHEVISFSQLASGTTHLECDGRGMFIYRDGDEISIYDNRCPHQETLLPSSALEGQVLTCSKHRWKFDVTSGQCIEEGDRPLRRMQSKIEDGKVYAFF